MKQIEFLEEIRKAYLKARKFIYKPTTHAGILTRGTSHSISSVSEDLFACYCANKVTNPSEIKIIIDPPLSFKGTGLKNKSEKKSLLIRPDVAICKSNKIICLFHIKTDLGYKRKTFLSQARERNLQMNEIKSHTAKLNDGETKISGNFKISDNIKFVYIVISPGNISKTIQQKMLEDFKGLENLNIFVLAKGQHLNSYEDLPEWEINKTDFDALDLLLEKYVN